MRSPFLSFLQNTKLNQMCIKMSCSWGVLLIACKFQNDRKQAPYPPFQTLRRGSCVCRPTNVPLMCQIEIVMPGIYWIVVWHYVVSNESDTAGPTQARTQTLHNAYIYIYINKQTNKQTTGQIKCQQIKNKMQTFSLNPCWPHTHTHTYTHISRFCFCVMQSPRSSPGAGGTGAGVFAGLSSSQDFSTYSKRAALKSSLGDLERGRRTRRWSIAVITCERERERGGEKKKKRRRSERWQTITLKTLCHIFFFFFFRKGTSNVARF